jgi:hypothetical protein
MPITASEPDALVSAVVWSDPSADLNKFIASARGCGYIFGPLALKDFLRESNCKMLVRAHECVLHGLATFFHGQGLTVFSTSNYSGRGNQAGFVQLSETGALEPHQLQPEESIIERNEAEFEAVTEVEETKPRYSVTGQSSLSTLPQIRLASYPSSKLSKTNVANRASGIVMKPGDTPASRRSAVKRLSLTATGSVSSLPTFSWLALEDPE